MSSLSKKLKNLKDYRCTMDPKIKDEIIIEYAPLIKYIAQKISSRFPATNIIMISSLAQENIVLDSITAGAQDFIQKPIKKEILIGSIEKIAESIQEEMI